MSDYTEEMTNEQRLNYQLGEFVGDYIFRIELPILDFENVYEKNSLKCIIKLSDEDKIEHDRLEKICWVNGKIDSELHKAFVAFRKSLERKYMKNRIEVYFEPILITDTTAFLNGVEFALWDSDFSSYVVDMEHPIKYEDGGLMSLTLKLYCIDDEKE
jgi:hypothetical protein